MARARVCVVLLTALMGVAAIPQPTLAGRVTAEQLQERIDGLVADIRAGQDGRGRFGTRGMQGWDVGLTALGVLALRAAGVPSDDEDIAAAVRFLLQQTGEGELGVYEAALRTMALQSVDPGAYRDEIAAGAGYLMRVQQGSGGWSYGESGRTDNSNSQFAILGLNAAALSGVEVPADVWRSAHAYFSAGQNPDGGWHYRVRSGRSYGSMTAAGVASLYVCDMWLHVHQGVCGVYPGDQRVQMGLRWLAQNFSVTRNPHSPTWKFYYLYALERAGVILARRYFGRHDWYREGVDHLVADPEHIVLAPSEYERQSLQKFFTLLFLAKGNAPVLMHKAQWVGGWNHHRYDAKFLVQYVGDLLGQPLDWQIVPLDAPLDQLMAAPILYVSGRGLLSWDRKHVERLREFMDAGGFVLVEAAGGDQAFDLAFRRLIKDDFPKQSLTVLPKDHPIYSSHFDIPVRDRPRLEALKGPCWISLLYVPDGLSCPWDVAKFEHVNFKAGANIAAYATGFDRLEGKLVEPVYYLPSKREAAPRRGAFTMGQLVHGGDWQPHKVAWPKVLAEVNERAGLAVFSEPIPIRVDIESPFQAQMLYITGVQEISLNAEAARALRLYLERGGFIFAEAACGSERFDASFRRLVGQLLPGQELKPLPLGHPLFQGGEPVDQVAYSPAVQQAAPDLRRPSLEYVEQDGRAVLVYSKYDLSSAIDGHPCFSCPAVLQPSAGRLALKIVLYGLSS